MSAKPAEARDDDGKRELILALSKATTHELVNGISQQFNASIGELKGELQGFKLALLGDSKVDKDSGVLPVIKNRISRLEKCVLLLALGMFAAIASNPKAAELALKMLEPK